MVCASIKTARVSDEDAKNIAHRKRNWEEHHGRGWAHRNRNWKEYRDRDWEHPFQRQAGERHCKLVAKKKAMFGH